MWESMDRYRHAYVYIHLFDFYKKNYFLSKSQIKPSLALGKCGPCSSLSFKWLCTAQGHTMESLENTWATHAEAGTQRALSRASNIYAHDSLSGPAKHISASLALCSCIRSPLSPNIFICWFGPLPKPWTDAGRSRESAWTASAHSVKRQSNSSDLPFGIAWEQ